jgi:hypothetical protein
MTGGWSECSQYGAISTAQAGNSDRSACAGEKMSEIQRKLPHKTLTGPTICIGIEKMFHMAIGHGMDGLLTGRSEISD